MRQVRSTVAHRLELGLLLSVQHLLLLRRHLRTARRLVAWFSAVVTHWRLFTGHVSLLLGRWWQLEAWMHKFALRSRRTESGQVVHAEHTSYVTMAATRSVSTEAAVIPRTIFDFALRVNVQERTFFVVACVEAGVEVAFRHLSHIVFVQELALVSLLAKTTQPMFAHYRPIAVDVSEGACITFVAGVLAVEAVVEEAHRCGGFWKKTKKLLWLLTGIKNSSITFY